MSPASKPNRRRNQVANEKRGLDFEIGFFEGIIRQHPRYVEALQILGDAYTKTGDWKKGLTVDRRLARLCPDNPLVFYNLACTYALLHRPDPAFRALRKAVRLGYADAHWLANDPDLADLRRNHRFQRILEELKHGNGKSTTKS